MLNILNKCVKPHPVNPFVIFTDKTTSLNRTYSQIYEKYGYPTFKLSKTQVPSKVQLSKLNDSNFYLKMNNVC